METSCFNESHPLSFCFRSDPVVDDSEPVALNQDDTKEETEKHQMKRNESEKPEHEAKGHSIFNLFAV